MRTEHMLSEYLIKIKDLYAAASFLETSLPDETTEVVRQFERIISRVKLLSMIHDRYVIAVSGFQGAGKTTLVNWFLNDTPWNQNDANNYPWLPERGGVGENLPVLVTCRDELLDVHATLHSVENPSVGTSRTITEERINSPGKCSRIVSKPENNHLLMELQIPTPQQLKSQTGNHFLDGVSLLLLPGYEVIVDEMTEAKKYRQQYMKMALTACANALLVIDGSHAARGNQEAALEEITKTFRATTMQYIITHADNSDGSEVHNKLVDQGVSERNITHSGTMSDKFIRSMVDDWRGELLRKISEYSTENQALRETQRDNIKLLTRDVDRVVRQVIQLKDSLEIEEVDSIKQMETLLKRFDESSNKIRKIFLNETTDAVAKLMSNVRDGLDSTQKKRGLFEKWGDWFREKIFGPETIENFRQAYTQIFEEKLEKIGGQGGLLFSIYNRSMNKLGVYTDLLESGTQMEIKTDAIQKYLPQNEYRLDVETINNIQVVAGSDRVSRHDPNRKFDRAMAVLPYVIFDSQRLQMVMDGNEWATLFANGKDYQAAVDSFSTHFGNVQIDTKSFLAGIVSLMGADLLPDGKLDSIGGLFSALFGGGNAAAAEATTTAGATAAAGGTAATEGAAAAASTSAVVVAGVVVGLLVLKSLNDASIGYNLKKLGTLLSLADSHENGIKARFKNEFDAMFQRVRDLIEYRLSDYLHLDTTKGEHLRLQNRIQLCRNLSTDIRTNLRQEGA